MASPVAAPDPNLLDVTAFLDWDDGTGIHYQLIRGVVVAMAPPLDSHGTLLAALAAELRGRLSPGCRVAIQAGIKPPLRLDTFYEADLVVSCRRASGERFEPAPVLIAEILSDSTKVTDRGIKLGDYQTIPGLQAILHLDPRLRTGALWQRRGDGLWPSAPQELAADEWIQPAPLTAPLDLSLIFADLAR